MPEGDPLSKRPLRGVWGRPLSSTLDQGRGLLGFLGPITGKRATGKVMIKPAAGTLVDVSLPPNTWFSPVINGALYPQMLYRVLPDYTASGCGAWVIPPAGALVDFEAHLGGTRYELVEGTLLRWADGVPPGFDVGTATTSAATVATGGISGADNTPIYGTDLVRGVSIYESLGTPAMQLELFRAALGRCPSVLAVWTGSGASKFAGRGAARYPEVWDLMIIVDRADTDPARRGEGLRLLDAVEDLVLWRTVYGDEGNTGKGGIIVSADTHVMPRSRRRVTGTSPFFQQAYIYAISITATRVAERVDFRTFGPWNLTRLDVDFPVRNPPGDPEVFPIVENDVFPMIQDP